MSRKPTARPELVRILGREFTIDYELDDPASFGQCDYATNSIEIMDGQPPVEERDTVLHEIMHGIWHLMDIGHSRIEETVVRKMATGLTQVFQDNPDLMKYLSTNK